MEPEEVCQSPCAPTATCVVCYAYWQRMEAEGFWQDGRWTEKGWREIMRHA